MTQSTDSAEPTKSINQPGDSTLSTPIPSSSATTDDIPAFGWSAYAERVNGRFAMVGFMCVLLIEAFSGQAFLSWSGMLS